MREILFRGKTTYGTWCEGFLCNNIFNERSIQPIDDIPCIEIDQGTVGQFTGLFDKNGKKIFEGDIVRCTIRDGMGIVRYRKTINVEVRFVRGVFRPLQNCDLKSVEVIGNIYDNPGLLKEN